VESGIRLQFSKEFFGRLLRSQPALRDEEREFDEAKCADGYRPAMVYFRSDDPQLLFGQLGWIASPVQDDMSIGQELKRHPTTSFAKRPKDESSGP
jgi:hypothetical protein